MRLLLTSLFMIFSSLSAGAVEFKFADPEKAAEILLAQDAYFEKLGPVEIALRLESETADKTVEDMKAEMVTELQTWTAEEKAQFEGVVNAHQAQIERIAHLLPETVWFIRGTAAFDGGLPHTQGNAIIIQANFPEMSPFLFFHELFHVLSRHNPDKHASLYGLLGFQACQFDEPASMAERHLTNPDVPLDMGYYLPLADGGAIMPYLYSSTAAFDPTKEGGFPAHFGFGLLQIDVVDGVCSPVMTEDGTPSLKAPGEVPAFFEAIGQNTGYIIHPEETISDNFTFLMIGWPGEEPMPNPEIPEKIGAWIDAQK